MKAIELHPGSGHSSISHKKRAVFAAIVLVVLYLFLETLSYFALSWRNGRWYTWLAAEDDRTRAILSDASRAPEPTFVPTMEGIVHPYLGFALPPNWEPLQIPDWASVKDFTNTPCDGFASLTPVLQKRSDDRVIIGIFGGSVAEIFYFQGTPFLQKKLREHPRFQDKELVVVGLGRGGYKQPQQLMALDYLLALGGELDVVINLDGFNEVALHPAENQKRGVYPIYPRAWSARVGQIRDHNILKLYGQAALQEEQLQDMAHFFSLKPMFYSPTCHLVWRAWQPILEKRLQRLKTAIEDSAVSDNSIRTGEGYRPADEQQMYEDLIQLWENGSRQMDALCAANQIQYYHFLQPNQYLEGSKPLTEFELKTAFDEHHPYREGVTKGYPQLRQAGERLAASGERFIDLSDVFATETGQIYVDTCCHFGSRGNQMIAERIGQAIISGQAGK